MRIARLWCIPVMLLCATACSKEKDSTRLRISGTVELEPVRITPLSGGRILELAAEEGVPLVRGQVVARLDCSEPGLQLVSAQAAHRGARAKLTLMQNGAQSEDIAQAGILVAQQETVLANVKLNLERVKLLYDQNAVTQKEFDDLQTTYRVNSRQLDAARQQYKKLSGGARKEEVEAAAAGVEQAQAAIDLIRKRMEYCTVLAPIDGVVLHRLAEPGEVASPGVALATIAGIDTVKVRGFVAELDLPVVRLGGPARVYTDAAPRSPLPGTVTFVSSEAEFTPKNIQTRSERVKTVYEIRVTVKNPSGLLKDGMPVEIELDR